MEIELYRNMSPREKFKRHIELFYLGKKIIKGKEVKVNK